ncbi:MAG: hypothetical protein ACTSU4_10775 [Promethearchaeota archaeon]
MKKETPPPVCYVCKKNFENSLEDLYYCICDISVCSNCISSVQANKTTWICPKCKNENDLQHSKLIREV